MTRFSFTLSGFSPLLRKKGRLLLGPVRVSRQRGLQGTGKEFSFSRETAPHLQIDLALHPLRTELCLIDQTRILYVDIARLEQGHLSGFGCRHSDRPVAVVRDFRVEGKAGFGENPLEVVDRVVSKKFRLFGCLLATGEENAGRQDQAKDGMGLSSWPSILPVDCFSAKGERSLSLEGEFVHLFRYPLTPLVDCMLFAEPEAFGLVEGTSGIQPFEGP